MEQRLQVFLALLIRAKYSTASEEKSRLLREANIELEVLRFQVRQALDLGAFPRQSHGHCCTLKQNVRRFRRRLRWLQKSYASRQISSVEIWARLASWLGHARHANCRRLIARLEPEWAFKRRDER